MTPSDFMRSRNEGSIGEIPPSTRGISGLTSAMALHAAIAISAKRLQSGSTSGSQCDLLFGSFQILTASIIGPPRVADRPDHRPAGARSAGRYRPRPPDDRKS